MVLWLRLWHRLRACSPIFGIIGLLFVPKTTRPVFLDHAQPSVFASVQYLFVDIDDTLTKDGKLGARAYAALWGLTDAGVRVIPVTGRPAGWCDMIVRQWPVAAVVGENGALAFYLRDGVRQDWYNPSVVGDATVRLRSIAQEVFESVAGTRPAKDQFSRLFDFAVDFAEEPPFLDLQAARRIADLCISAGAKAKISSIHVNFWLGDYDKLSGVKAFMDGVFGVDQAELREHGVFCGDSANDEPMFGFFPISVAVKNVESFLPMMEMQPAHITRASHGDGFAELAELVRRVLEERL